MYTCVCSHIAALIFKCYFLQRYIYIYEQTPFTMMFTSGSRYLAELTEAMRNKCLAQRMQIGAAEDLNQSTSV